MQNVALSLDVDGGKTVVVSSKMPQEVVDLIDDIAKRRRRTRSQVIRQMMLAQLARGGHIVEKGTYEIEIVTPPCR